MVSILDIKRRSSVVETPDGDITVYAVSAAGITSIMSLVPTVRKLMAGTAKLEELSIETLISVAPDFVAAVIAAGVDAGDDAATIEAAGKLAIGIQVDILKGVLEASMPKGLGPFLESLAGITSALASASGGKVLATK